MARTSNYSKNAYQSVVQLLNIDQQNTTSNDFNDLLAAASHLEPEHFVIFLNLFSEQGRNLRATNRAGQTALDIIRTQYQKTDYVQALANALSRA